MCKETLTREEMINHISKVIERTHNEKDKEDLLTFSYEELKEIYNNIN